VNGKILAKLLNNYHHNFNTQLYDNEYDTCLQSKAVQPIGKTIKVPKCIIPFEQVHSDLCRPMPVPTPTGKRYYVVFIDEFGRYNKLFSRDTIVLIERL
jgi:hypothetical protein